MAPPPPPPKRPPPIPVHEMVTPPSLPARRHSDPWVYPPPPPPPDHSISENTKVWLTLGRTVVVITAVFCAGWVANERVTQVLHRQDRMDEKLTQVLTKHDLAEMETRVERRLLERFASRSVRANCPVLTVRGQSHKPCEIVGLTSPHEDLE